MNRIGKSNIFVLILMVSLVVPSFAVPPLNEPKYSNMKQEFLNIDENYFTEVVFNNYVNDPTQDFPQTDGENILEIQINEGGYQGWSTYGGTYWCPNKEGKMTLCRYSTGGSPGNNQPVCGESVGNDYQTAVNFPERHCNPGNWEDWSGTRLWLGAGSNSTFILPLFDKLKNGPANRFCFEIEFPEDRLRYHNSDFDNASHMAHIVNQDVSHDNLDHLFIHFGTYSSPYLSDSGTNDEEIGGSFQGGGSHWYHNPASYTPPLDKAYALDENTIVACMGNSPKGVRSGMRPPYSYNPLMTVVGDNAEGLTDAYAYIPYMARVYFDLADAEARHPLNIRYNAVWALYEHNDIFAMSGKGSVLGVDMILDGETATYPFTIFNNAPEDRSYLMTMMAGGNLPLRDPSSHFRMFIDENGNKIKDADETQELFPAETLTLTAKTDIHLLLIHTPDFDSGYQSKTRYGNQFAQAGVTLIEVGRMRSASYAIRTWRGTAAEIQNKESILSQRVYPTPDSVYATEAQWNQDKPNNTRLIRNSPDFQMALTRLANLPPDNEPPSIPANLKISQVTSNSITLEWEAATDNRSLTGYRLEYARNNNFSDSVTFDIGNVTGHSIVGLDPATQYFIRVRALDSFSNQSGPSNVVNATTQEGQANRAPVIDLFTNNAVDRDLTNPGIQVFPGDSVIYSASASDPDGNSLQWNWYYSTTGQYDVPFSNGTGAIQDAVFEYPSGSAGILYEWILEVSDGDRKTIKTVQIQVIGRADPSEQNPTQQKFINLLNKDNKEVVIPCRSPVSFYNTQGHRVQKSSCNNGFAHWKGETSEGEQASSGKYIVQEDGQPHRFVMIVR